MDKGQIVELIAKEKKVEQLLSNVTKKNKDILKEDLTQDIYLELLSKPDVLIEELYKKGELDFFIVKIITNNVFSKNSPYHYKYAKYKNNKITLDEENDNY